jgi:hypothetical protein
MARAVLHVLVSTTALEVRFILTLQRLPLLRPEFWYYSSRHFQGSTDSWR